MNIVTNLENQKTIDIFSMTPKKGIRKYKESELEKIPYEQRLLEASTNYEKLLENEGNEVRSYNIFYDSSDMCGGGLYHSLEVARELKDDYKKMCDKLTNDYLGGRLKYADAKRIDYGLSILTNKRKPDINSILITDGYKQGEFRNGVYIMSNILNLTRKLFFLQLLENGQFEYFKDKEVDEQLDLFVFKKIASIGISNFDDLIKYGAINPNLINTDLIGGM